MSSYTLLLRPGKSEPIEAQGTFCSVVSSPCDIYVRLDKEEEVLLSSGDSVGDSSPLSAGQEFKWVTVRNPTTKAIVVVVYVGTRRYEQRRRLVLDALTEIVGRTSTSLAAGETVSFLGEAEGAQIQRKQIIVSNMDNGGNLEIRDGAGNVCANVFPLTTVTLPISGPLSVKNNTGLPVTCYISEIWYVTA